MSLGNDEIRNNAVRSPLNQSDHVLCVQLLLMPSSGPEIWMLELMGLSQ